MTARLSAAAFQRLSSLRAISLQTLILWLESLRGTLPAEVEEVKFLREELQTVYQPVKALLEPCFHAESLSEGLEESLLL